MEVRYLRDCEVYLQDGNWAFAREHTAQIRAHWAEASANNPAIYEGEVFVLPNWEIDGDILKGQLIATSFSSYYFWRGLKDRHQITSEAFATALVMPADGGVLVARAASGSLNGGHFVMPGGLLDKADLGADGRMQFAHTAARELREETGLGEQHIEAMEGYVLANHNPFLAVGRVFRSHLSANQLLAHVQAFLDGETKPEIAEPRIIRSRAELDALPSLDYARALVGAVLDETWGEKPR